MHMIDAEKRHAFPEMLSFHLSIQPVVVKVAKPMHCKNNQLSSMMHECPT